ncbi:hypothetical protein NKG94_03635 [Micromonospora sp. M12]
MVTDHYLRGAYYPEGGGQVLAASLVEVIEAHGGEVRTRCASSRSSSRVAGQPVFESVASRIPERPAGGVQRRLPPYGAGVGRAGALPGRVVKRTRAAIMGMPFVTLYLGLKRPLPPRPNANVWWYDVDVDDYYKRLATESPDDVRSCSCPSRRTRTPARRRSARRVTPTSRR